MRELPSVAKRFLRYITYDTQSSESSNSYPSTEKQKELSKLLVAELLELGLKDAYMDQYGYVYATLESNIDNAGNIPVICFLAHVDTSPEVSGKNVRAQIHYDYKGGPIKLRDNLYLSYEQSPELEKHIGHTIITTDGTTLLGADDKAGIAEIMSMLEILVNNPQIPRGKIRVIFTVDEEVGGLKFFDVKKIQAQYGYTVDGGGVPGEIENETFCADSAKITFKGISVHPGSAKGKMINSIKVASEFISLLPKNIAPETTANREGFIHVTSINGGVDTTTVKLIFRSFELGELKDYENLIFQIIEQIRQKYLGIDIEYQIEENYRNMKIILDQHPKVIEYAKKAVQEIGIEPKLKSIRGGTDGARLSFMGMPCANLFTGGNLFHSRYEWVSVEVMELAVKTLVNLVKIWAIEK